MWQCKVENQVDLNKLTENYWIYCGDINNKLQFLLNANATKKPVH